VNHYRKLILQQSYDSLMINLKIFCKSGPRVQMMFTGYNNSSSYELSWYLNSAAAINIDMVALSSTLVLA